MYKTAAAALVTILMMVGCSRATPLAPDIQNPTPQILSERSIDSGPNRLLGEWKFFIDAENERVDIVPRRDMHLHLNALKFLEDYCKDCLEITSIKNNGDSTIDLTVRITHPFNGFPEYTGFDVKGIIMFNGSYEYPNDYEDTFDLPSPSFRVSWREMGDPELMNPDGYTPRWSPNWDSGSDLPIFNYWRGKYSSGTPNADLNAFLNFYSREERHMFTVDSQVSRTYTIYMPTNKIVAGYAVEACWEEPLVMPVTNPLEDFPISANQKEAYYFHYVVNNGEEITDCSVLCCGYQFDCSDLRVELGYYPELWPDEYERYPSRVRLRYPGLIGGDLGLEPCAHEGWYRPAEIAVCDLPNGTYRLVVFNHTPGWDGHHVIPAFIAYDVSDFTINDRNH